MSNKILQSIPENSYLKTIEECNERDKLIYDIVVNCIKKIKRSSNNSSILTSPNSKQIKVDFSISDNDGETSIYIIGNKRAGTKYDLNEWKTKPLYSCKVKQIAYSNSDYYLDLYINFTGPKFKNKMGNFWKLNHNDLVAVVEDALKNAIFDFVEYHNNII